MSIKVNTKTFYADTAQERKAFAQWLRTAQSEDRIDRSTYEDYVQCYLDCGEVEVVEENGGC